MGIGHMCEWMKESGKKRVERREWKEESGKKRVGRSYFERRKNFMWVINGSDHPKNFAH